jgi:ABC-2 type transport system ATP-binding protein
MRMIMGLDRPTSGTVTVNGKPYRQHRAPLREVRVMWSGGGLPRLASAG